MNDLVDRLHHRAIGRFFDHSLHEAAVYLDEIDGKPFQAVKRRQAAAEIIQRKTEAVALQAVDEVDRLGVAVLIALRRSGRDRRPVSEFQLDTFVFRLLGKTE